MRRSLVVAIVVAALLLTGWALTPPRLAVTPTATILPGDIEAWLDMRERTVDERFSLIPETEKRLRWQAPGTQTDYVVVHLHGFSATRQETAPLADIVADRLGANLFETRLAGHGHATLPMHEVRAEDWLQDAEEALTIGSALGERIVLLSTSTGGTLSLAMLGHPLMQHVDTLVLMSPNLAPAAPSARWLTRPGGPLIARLVAGETRSWTAHNDLQERYWSTSYPTDAVVEVMRLVDLAQATLPASIDQRVLMLVSADDQVVSPSASRLAFEQIEAPASAWIDAGEVGDPSNHVLAGAILSPASTDAVAVQIVEFVRSPAGASDQPAGTP